MEPLTYQLVADGDVLVTLRNSVPPKHILVSSRHLILASPVFKIMLDWDWKESEEFHRYGYVALELDHGSVAVGTNDDDFLAMIVLMLAIHGKFRLIPKSFKIDFLAKIAFLVGKYEVLESVYLYID